MDFYKIEWKASALKDLKRLDKWIVPRILQAVDSLKEQPLPHDVRKIRGSERSYRIRVGDYRVVYTIEEDLLIVEIVRVRHRKDVYR
jgi:mRNA interferase RelE/StbE